MNTIQTKIAAGCVLFAASALSAGAATLVAVSSEVNGIHEYSVDGTTWTHTRQITTQNALQMVHHGGVIYATTESSVLSINVASGAVTTLATRGSGIASSWTTGNAQGIVFGPDGDLYFSTAFNASGSGIYKLDTAGTTFSQFISYSGTGYTLNNARDLVWVGDNLYVSSRAGFNATGRPIYEFDDTGAYVGTITTGTGLQAPQSLYAEGGTLYIGSGNSGTQIRTIDLAGTLPNDGSVLATGGQNILDILRIEGILYTAHYNSGTGSVGEIRIEAGAAVLTNASGTLNGMVIIPEPSSVLLGLSSFGFLLMFRRRVS